MLAVYSCTAAKETPLLQSTTYFWLVKFVCVDVYEHSCRFLRFSSFSEKYSLNGFSGTGINLPRTARGQLLSKN
uniref:Uncharacterized protein n=1 Tax=Solanum tuberosum TaxID=4113 RepID=M1BRG9_SOLTU